MAESRKKISKKMAENGNTPPIGTTTHDSRYNGITKKCVKSEIQN
jgi:hypothetical protein